MRGGKGAEKRKYPPRRFVNEATMFKVLIERDGALLSVTLKRRAFFLFLSPLWIGIREAPTTDPLPGIVELSNYEIRKIIKNWDSMHNLIVRRHN